MGVQGLWQLLHPAGKPVSPASLEGKVLAVDVSIWLHQTMKGMRDKDGNPLPNAHLQGLFSRICKLLFYRIRPIFVFDGGVPALKKQTLAARRERKENVDREKGRTSQKILQNLLRSHAVRDVTGDRTEHISVPPSDRPAEPDIFQLPPLPEVDRGSTDPIENAGAWEAEADEAVYQALYQSYENDFQNLEDIDFESEEFQSLPAEIRHEILSEMKEQRRENALARIAIMPEESEDFSDYQLKKLIKQSQLSGKIESLRKEMNQKVSGDISYALGDDYYGEVVEARRVASEDAAHYILIKGLTRKQQIAEAERCKARRLMKEERRLERNPDKVNQSLETVEEMGEEKVSDSDEVEAKVDAGSVGGRILSDDETSDDKEQRKSRRERRGKALVTRDGLRSVAKKGKRKPRVKCLTVSDDEEDDVPIMDKHVAADGKEHDIPVKGKSTKNKMALDDDKEDDLLVENRVKPEHEEDDLLVEGKSTSDHKEAGLHVEGKCKPEHEEDDLLVDGKSKAEQDEDVLLVEGKRTSDHDADDLLVEGKSTLDGDENDTAVTMVTRDQTNQSALTQADAGKSYPSKQTLESSLLSKEACSGVDSLFQGTYSRVDSLFQGPEQKPNIEVNTPENQTEKTLDLPMALQTGEESHFVETRKRLLTEEEDLMKAKEAKMAALMKSLEKRTRAVGSPPADRKSPAEEELSTQDTRKKLLQQEEELMKEKEVKMAALLKSVEKRSQLQSQSGQSSLKPEKGTSPKRNRLDQDSSEDEAEQASHGFLEDVVDLERQAILRKSRTRSANQAAPVRSESSSSSTSSKPLPFPALTVDYLEDVDAMLEINQDSSEICTALNETDRNSETSLSNRVSVLGIPVPPAMTTATQETSDKAEEGKPEVTKLAKATAVGEGRVKSGPVKGKIPSQDSTSGTGGFPSSRPEKRVASERLEGKAVKKQARVVSPPARTLQNNAEDSEDEGFIEITIDPTKVPEDDLFPASIFVTEPVADENPPQTGSSTSLQKRRTSSNKNNSDDHDDDNDVQGILPSGLHQRHLNVSDVEEDGCVAGMKQAMGSRSGHQQSIKSGEVAAPSARVVAEVQEVADGKEQGNVSMGSIENEEVNNFMKGVNSLADLYDLQRNLSSERQTLTLERGRQARLGKSITEQTNLEAQELLRLFGVPYVVSPLEAESQCAHLEMLGLTQGTITDDSDAWLFGAQNIYKNFFNQTKYVEFYSADAVYHRFGLDRRKLINLALLCGSDYTPGIPGVGPVRAMEVLAEFPGEGLEGLRAFREWWEDAKDGILPRYQGKVKSKLRTLQLHDGFPSRQVVEAYLNPAVDESEERFTWGMPDLQLLRQYAKQKFGWGREKVDDVLEPMMKELSKKMTQGRIHSYFQPENSLPPKPVQSKRLQKALDKFQNRGSSESESESTSGSESEDSEPALPEQGENIKKANQILSGSTKGRGRGSGSLRGKRGGKSDGLKGEVRGQSARGRGQSVASVGSRRGRDGRPAPLPKQLLVRDEVCLSESSSSSDDSLPEKPSTKKPRTLLPGKTAAAAQLHAKQQGAKPTAQKASSMKKKPSSAPKTNVRKLTPATSRPAPGSKRKSEARARGRKAVGAAVNEVAAFKEAMGGDLDPATMTIDDLGSDFSEDDFNA